MKIFCPRCGVEQASPEIRFCSRCGFVMNGMASVVLGGGLPETIATTGPKPRSARVRGLRQGGALFLSGIFFVPLLGVLSLLVHFPEEVIGLAAIVCFVGGIVRMLFAAIFESGDPSAKTLEENFIGTAQKVLDRNRAAGALPPQQSIPAESYMPPSAAPSWRDTNDLERVSVTDSTTKLLKEEKTNEL